MTEKLSPNFLNEMFRTAFRNKSIFEILANYLEFHYLPTQEYKQIWKDSKLHYDLNHVLPTIGIIAEKNKLQAPVLQQLDQIRKADVIEKASLVKQMETYLRDVKFINLYDEIGELRKEGKKEEAIKALQKGTEEISQFSLQSEQFESVFSDFEYRYTQRALENASRTEFESKCSFGIDELDERTRGGVDKGKTCLFTARSGVGKSKLLKWIAYANARMGKNVLHFQFEGSKEECLLSYESMMTGSPYFDLKTTTVDDKKLQKTIDNSNKIIGDIHVIAYEEFGSASLQDVRNSCLEYIKKTNQNPDMIILDYLDEADPGDGKRYSATIEGEKARKQAVAKAFTNLCVELNMSGFIATQASDVPPAIWNDPNQVLTRSNIGQDKNLVNKFSYHITLNRTKDEYKNETMRLYEDKYRDHPEGKTHYICTNYKLNKFYDRKRTKNIFSK